MVYSANLGFPRIGVKREYKKALENYWKSAISEAELTETLFELRLRHWNLQKDAGIDIIPSGDFAPYDQVLNVTAALGAVPKRFGHTGNQVSLDTYFAMARGTDNAFAMEMSKWFDTNYHYIVPEISPELEFKLSSTWLIDDYIAAKQAGIETRPVIVGPATYLYLSKATTEDFDKYSRLADILPVYCEILTKLKDHGCEWVQIDEPALVMDLTEQEKQCFETSWKTLQSAETPKLMLATYFGEILHNLPLVNKLNSDGLHIDLVRAPEQLSPVLEHFPTEKALSLGIIDGRNIWRADLNHKLSLIEKALVSFPLENLQIAPSCSLLHTPIDLELEKKLDPQIKSWMSFALQKLQEITILKQGLANGRDAISHALRESDKAVASRMTSKRIHNANVRQRMENLSPKQMTRNSVFSERQKQQAEKLNLPLLPTTTIGSFPQTSDVRKARAAFKKKSMTKVEYDAFLKAETEKCIRFQEEIDIDVLVHGEFERNDMVEYFGEQLDGFAFTQNGWVQSYGSRGVKPPVIFGDISRPKPMTVDWATYAQSLTKRPVKGMLTGPVTILQWSFVRDDQPRSETCYQIGFAIRDEVQDLEKAGIEIIQIDEAALREGLPLRQKDHENYLKHSVNAFRLCSSGVHDNTQVHTHMCYSEFNDIMPDIARMDADVISIETSRSNMELLNSFGDFKYPSEIGPGVYDIHSPRVPKVGEMENLLTKALEVLDPRQIWVNPDCGLKTRGWPEVEQALKQMVEAAHKVRTRLN